MICKKCNKELNEALLVFTNVEEVRTYKLDHKKNIKTEIDSISYTEEAYSHWECPYCTSRLDIEQCNLLFNMNENY